MTNFIFLLAVGTDNIQDERPDLGNINIYDLPEHDAFVL